MAHQFLIFTIFYNWEVNIDSFPAKSGLNLPTVKKYFFYHCH
ncbi:hypothetical protein HMPREF0496_1038 [Lentilactobacillus hilgardii ATCC 27305]|nr:hypothetical protein HMPREF0496_1038 [Lentilactobacillus hilgardii ATCC 27305]